MASKLETFLSSQAAKAEPATNDAGAAPATDGKPDEPVVTTDATASAPSAEKVTEATPAPAVQAATPEPDDDADLPPRERDPETGKFRPQTDAERGLRAALRKTRDELRAAKARSQQPPPEPPKRTSFYDDADKAAEELRAELRGEISKARFDADEAAAVAQHKDFAAVVTPFMQECEADPVLGKQVFETCQRAPNTAIAFYQAAKRYAVLKQYDGDLDRFASDREAPLKSKIAELEGQLAALTEKQKQLESIPTSIANAPNNQPGGGEAPGGKRTLGSIVGESRNRKRARAA